MTSKPLRFLLFAALASTANTATAFAINLTDFSDNTVDFVHGTVLESQYNLAQYGNLTISALNTGGGANRAVVFDSSLDSTRDPDLEDPFGDEFIINKSVSGMYNSNYGVDTTNISDPSSGYGDIRESLNSPGKIQIVQENDSNCNSGICTNPDDEAGGGEIIFDFGITVNLFSIDVFDMDGGNQAENVEFFFFKDGNSDAFERILISNTDFDGDGERDAGRVFFGEGVIGVDKMVAKFKSSGAINNLTGSVQVSEPSLLALIGAGLLLLRQARRQR